MKTGTMVFALTAAGILGGVAGALLVGGANGPAPVSPPAAPAAERTPGPQHEARSKEIQDLRNRIEALEAGLANAGTETARLKEDLATERKSSGEAKERLAALERAPAAGAEGRTYQGPRPQVDLGGASFAIGGREGGALADRFRRAAELRALPADERWQKARDALGLTLAQEEDLKAAIRERDESVRDSMKITTQDGKDGGSGQVTVAMPDMEKIRDARKKYEDRVGQTLNAEQAKKWKDEGYEGAMGGGAGTLITTAIRMDAPPAGDK